MKGLKSLFKQSNRNKGSLSEATSSHPEKRLGPAQPLDEHRKQERESSSDLPRGPYSHNRQSAPSSHASLTYPSSRPSVQYPASGNGDRSVGATGFAAQSPSLSERDYDTIRDDYRAYMGAISPGSAVSIASTDAERYSLGSDRRLITGNSEMKYNEDIADRNIEHYGSISPLNGSLRSLNSATRAAQYHNVRRKSIAASIESLGTLLSSASVCSDLGSTSSIRPKYALGTGVVTEGGLVDSILPHIEDPHARPYDRKNWPRRIARDESHLSRSRNRRDKDEVITSNGKRRDRTMDLREAIMAGPGGHDPKANLDGVVDLTDTEDTDKDVQWAPAVTHEVVNTHQHEVIEERIYREIHNHDVYRYIQPVYQTEILPARHFVYNTNNELVEVSVDQLPECTGAKQRWAVVRDDGEKPVSHTVRSTPPRQELKILSDKTHVTPEGYERRETTILHPPELEDLSKYGGPVVPIEFLHHPAPVGQKVKEEKGPDKPLNRRQFTMGGLANTLSAFRPGSSSSSSSSSYSSRAYIRSSASSPALKRLSIPRKPVPTPHSS